MVRFNVALAAVFLASPACAGKLDLDLFGNVRPRFTRPQKATVPQGELWRPGDPRYAQGESLTVQTIAAGGNAGLGAAGFAQSIGSAGKSREAAAMSAGFGAVALVGLWRTWKVWRGTGEK